MLFNRLPAQKMSYIEYWIKTRMMYRFLGISASIFICSAVASFSRKENREFAPFQKSSQGERNL